MEHYIILLYGASSYSCLFYNMYAVNKLSNVSMYLCTTIFIVFPVSHCSDLASVP